MKVRLHCAYYNAQREKIGEPGDVLESPKDATAEALRALVNGGSADVIEPPKKSERD